MTQISTHSNPIGRDDQSTQTTQATQATQASRPRPQWQIELLWAGSGIAFALTVLPVAIFFVGKWLLGDYAGGSLGGFFVNYFGSLLNGSRAAWSLALGPALALAAVRYSLKLYQPVKPSLPLDTSAPSTPVAHTTARMQQPIAQRGEMGQRREPFIGS